MPDAFQIRFGKGNRRPERLRPDPERQPLYAVFFRHGNAPLDIAGKAERHQRFAGTEPDAVCGKNLARRLAVGKFVKENAKHALCLVHLIAAGKGRQFFFCDCLKLALGINDRILEKLPAGKRRGFAQVFLFVLFVHHMKEERAIAFQVKIPVFHIAQHRALAGKRADRGNQFLREILVPKGAFIRISDLGFAPLNGASARDLTAVEKRAEFFIVKLLGGKFHQRAACRQFLKKLRAVSGVNPATLPEAACRENRRADFIFFQRARLTFVVHCHEIPHRAFEFALGDKAFVFFHNRGAVAVRSGHKNYVIRADPVA